MTDSRRIRRQPTRSLVTVPEALGLDGHPLFSQTSPDDTRDIPAKGATRLDLYLSATAALKPDRLSRHGNMSRAQVLGTLLTQAGDHIIQSMTDDAPEDDIIG